MKGTKVRNGGSATKRLTMAALAAATAFTTLFVVAGTAGPAAAAGRQRMSDEQSGSGAADRHQRWGIVLTAANTTTYTFSSLTNENPSRGVPGLIKYCVYPSPTSQPTAIAVQAKGANNAKWISSKGSNNFAFVRPGGDKTNIPLDGKTTTMGTATWTTPPTDQTIVLHINDPTVCRSLYGATTPATCFVLPAKPATGPVCDKGDTNVAYNAMPFDVVNCLNPAVGFQANQWNEFGDSVTLASTGTLKSMIVDFQSFACVTGAWDQSGNPCGGGTTPGVSPGTFTWPITANIYAAGVDGLPTGGPLATTTVDAQIPFRPNADPTGCPSTPTKWFNPLAPGGGACQNSIATKLTFDLSGQGALPADGKVVWTVAFNTSTWGYSPQGTQTPPCALPAATATTTVCPENPADSLNVGDKTYPAPAPYAGTSLFDTNGGLAVGSQGGPLAPLGFIDPDDHGRPLGEIITAP